MRKSKLRIEPLTLSNASKAHLSQTLPVCHGIRPWHAKRCMHFVISAASHIYLLHQLLYEKAHVCATSVEHETKHYWYQRG